MQATCILNENGVGYANGNLKRQETSDVSVENQPISAIDSYLFIQFKL